MSNQKRSVHIATITKNQNGKIVLRIIAPGSKLANLTSLQPETAEHSLADELQLEEIETPELYEALDWLLKRQTRIENKLAKKHLEDGTLVLRNVLVTVQQKLFSSGQEIVQSQLG